ncbi:transporter substrate-binding domain-containing protein [Bradyrhizobium sp. Pear77]|uniref:transporter substrate-binding domain-containing protein n=1 Tax=Bradyrhizobium altum TaxID=1571202 RepID=UPI001E426330|nr:transporter substrate-binding domain-containing protein [Bradyrhizobium altum]MCC8954233.1 transporter substrate-binding domain-containing protein [Bradyrhizobium altum]
MAAALAIAALLLASVVLLAPPANAQDESTVRELVIGTKDAPPFAIKNGEGEWSGISIELWRKLADQLKLRYRFVEAPSVTALLEGVQAGKFDVAVAAITVTPAREKQVDFTLPYFQTGTGVAVQTDHVANWMPVIRSIVSYGFVQAALALLGLAILAGLLIWMFEHNANEGFGRGLAHGLSSGVLWSTHTMTQRVVGGAAPITLPGRIVAVVWMIVSVIAIAVFTAGITSALTTKRLHGAVNSIGDLSAVRVGVVQGTATEDALSRMRIKHHKVASVAEGFQALQQGSIDALAYDRPILAWMIRQGSLSAELTDVTFEPQSYAIALREDRVLRKRLNIALLEAGQLDWWKDVLFRYLGQAN